MVARAASTMQPSSLALTETIVAAVVLVTKHTQRNKICSAGTVLIGDAGVSSENTCMIARLVR